MERVIQFLFVVAVPLLVVGGALVTLFAIGALFDALEHPEALRGRIEGLFQRPPKPARTPGKDHYYRRYWNAR